MKVYVVTDGEYSDYNIQKVFSNIEAAEEYKYWHHITNDIEEYEVADTALDIEEKRYWFIKVSGIVYPEAVVNIQYEIHPATINDRHIKQGVYVDTWEYKYRSTLKIWNYHYVSAENWNEEKYKEKYTKALYDQAALVKYMIADGADIDTIEKVLRKQEEEE